MEKEKMIEEMRAIAEVLSASWCRKGKCTENKCDIDDCDMMAEAREIYDAGYRKVPDGAVVLTKEEYYGLKNKVKWAKELGASADKIRKETAREIIELLKEKGTFTYDYPDEPHSPIIIFSDYILEELAEKYGMEVEE